MRYRVLGTTHAHRDDGTPVGVGGARLRALLTALALRPGRAVPVAVLVGEVWDGDPPADGVAALQALVGRLRRAIGHDAVTSTDGGYLLRAGEDDIDAYRFRRLAKEGIRAQDAGDPVKAGTVLADALALWQGPALADLPDRDSAAGPWETLRHEAVRASLAAALDLGRADEALPELTALCEAFPLDEPLQALRIRALRDPSRTAAALAAYERVGKDVAARLGTDPSPELRALHAELLAGERGPRRAVAPAPPEEPAVRAPTGAAPGRRPATCGPDSPRSWAARPTSGPSTTTCAPPDSSPSSGRAARARPGCPRRPPSTSPRGRARSRGPTVCGSPNWRPSTTRTACPRPCSPRSARARPCCAAPVPRGCARPTRAPVTPSRCSPSAAPVGGCCWCWTTVSMWWVRRRSWRRRC